MVQREVGERLAASAGDEAYGAVVGEGRVLGARRGGRAGARHRVPSQAQGRVGPRAHRPSRGAGGRRRRRPQVALHGSSAPASVSAARCCAARSPDVATLAQIEAAGIAPTARAEELDVEAWGRLAREAAPSWMSSFAPGQADRLRSASPGVRDDGYHLLDAEMVSLDLRDRLLDQRGRRARDRRPRGRGRAGRRRRTSSDARWRSSGERHTSASRSTSRPEAGSEAGRATRRRSCGGRGSTTSSVAASLGADVPFCLIGGRARVSGIGDMVEPLPFVDRTFTLVTPPFGVSTPAVYRAWDDLGGPADDHGNDLETAALQVEPRLHEWRERIAARNGAAPDARGQRVDVVRRRGSRPCGGVARTRDGGGDAHRPPLGAVGERERARLLAALEARALEHLLVLLLAHALAALLDQRSHGCAEGSGASWTGEIAHAGYREAARGG